MTYQDLVKKVGKALTAVDASAVSEHIAVQVNVVGEAEGAFYIEVADGKLAVEPYDYVDRDALLTAAAKDLVAVSAGKLSLEAALSDGTMTCEGNYDKLMVLGGVFAQLPVKKAAKPRAKKAETADAAALVEKAEKPAKKTRAKKCAAKTEDAAAEAPAKKTRAKKAAAKAETEKKA